MAPDTAEITPWAQMWQRDGFAFVLLATLALAFRFIILVQTSRTPFFEVANIDSASYQKWARELVSDGWWPVRNFYQSPFYAYFLAILYKVFGEGPWMPRVVQVVLGSLSPVLVYAMGTRLFSRRVGWIAGLLLCVYGPLVLEEVTLSKTSPLIVVALIGVAAYLRYAPSAALGGLAAAGFALGWAVQGVAQWLLPFALLAAFLPWMAPTLDQKRRGMAVAAFVGAGLVPVLPVVVWNTMQGGGVVLTSGGAGLNLYSGNNERATGLPASPSGVRDIPEYEEEDARRIAEKAVGGTLTSAGVDRYWSGRAMTYIREHPGDWLALMVKKFTVLWNWFEIPDNYHYAFMRAEFLPGLRLGTTLGLVGPLALVGVMLPFWRRRGLTAFMLVWVAYGLTPLIYYVRGRYRLPLAPFLVVLAAVAVDRLVRAITERRFEHVGGLAAGLLATTLFVNHTYCEPAHHGANALCFAGDIWYDLEWSKLGNFYQARGDLDSTLNVLERAATVSSPRGVGQTIYWRGDMERLKAEELVAAGDRAGAMAHYQLAVSNLKRSIAMRYRADGAQQILTLVEQRITDLQQP